MFMREEMDGVDTIGMMPMNHACANIEGCIIEPTVENDFDFKQLILTEPNPMRQSGNITSTTQQSYIFRLMNGKQKQPCYVQTPIIQTKNGFKMGTRKSGFGFIEIMFSVSTDSDFLAWMEQLETHCQHFLFEKRMIWLDDVTVHDFHQ